MIFRIPHTARLGALLAGAALILAACQTQADTPAATAGAPPAPRLLAEGEEIATSLCAVCHAVSTTDMSPHPEAPPLRELSQVYPVRALEEALAEGIMVGHPDMPPFQLEPDDIDALLTYLESIQDPV
ncbi:MAG: c-type cytochrome [Hyphomonas sp.]